MRGLSSSGCPEIAMTLVRSVCPDTMLSDVFGHFNVFASNLINAALALPASGKAVTWTFR